MRKKQIYGCQNRAMSQRRMGGCETADTQCRKYYAREVTEPNADKHGFAPIDALVMKRNRIFHSPFYNRPWVHLKSEGISWQAALHGAVKKASKEKEGFSRAKGLEESFFSGIIKLQ